MGQADHVTGSEGEIVAACVIEIAAEAEERSEPVGETELVLGNEVACGDRVSVEARETLIWAVRVNGREGEIVVIGLIDPGTDTERLNDPVGERESVDELIGVAERVLGCDVTTGVDDPTGEIVGSVDAVGVIDLV